MATPIRTYARKKIFVSTEDIPTIESLNTNTNNVVTEQNNSSQDSVLSSQDSLLEEIYNRGTCMDEFQFHDFGEEPNKENDFFTFNSNSPLSRSSNLKHSSPTPAPSGSSSSGNNKSKRRRAALVDITGAPEPLFEWEAPTAPPTAILQTKPERNGKQQNVSTTKRPKNVQDPFAKVCA
jgi:hypothetical protein